MSADGGIAAPAGAGAGEAGAAGRDAGAGEGAVFTVERLERAEDLPRPVWDELAPADDPMWGQDVFAAMQGASIGPDAYAYLLVRRDGRPFAALPLSAVRRLRLDRVVGPEERRLMAPVARAFPRLVRVSMLFCGNFLGQGHVMGREPLPAPAARLLVREVMAFAREHRLGTVVFKDFAPDGLGALRPGLDAAGFFTVAALPDTELPLGHADFEGFLASLPAKPRRNARSKIRKFEQQEDLRMEVLDEFGHLVPAMMGLYRQVMDRADQTLDVLDETFVRTLAEGADGGADGTEQRLVACFEGDRLVGYLHCLFRGSGAVGARIGLDYGLAHRARLYHNLHYAAIELAIGRGCRHIRFAQTAYEPKREFGCELVEQSYALTHTGRLPRAVLRMLLPRALEAAREQALAPKS
ncbi:GNAT family N-acetyltransferase [Streptomyces bambusae]|uniref:GNAT family N-acetyltransferase n=1 Tax=Streptomyces bambusae TaxID=1550616 RepID=UPI001CFD41A2|nr:GNAT family N-acetyltransferase [Streptomyces bambusae]MCB5164671.1 GNAT family N-acetyltransferase [Streptomyces bambusae]